MLSGTCTLMSLSEIVFLVCQGISSTPGLRKLHAWEKERKKNSVVSMLMLMRMHMPMPMCMPVRKGKGRGRKWWEFQQLPITLC